MWYTEPAFPCANPSDEAIAMSAPATGTPSSTPASGPGHAQTTAVGTEPGRGSAQIALAPAAKLEFWIRFMYFNPTVNNWDFIPADVECWMCIGNKDTVCGEKIKTVALPNGAHFEGPKPATPGDVAFVINFGKDKAIDPGAGTLVAIEENKLLVPVPELWESTSGVFVTGRGRAIYPRYDPAPGQVGGSERAPIDIIIPSQTVFYQFQIPRRGQLQIKVPVKSLKRHNDKAGIALKQGDQFDGTFLDALYGPIADGNKFGWKVELEEKDIGGSKKAPPKYDLVRNEWFAQNAGDPAIDKKFAYVKKDWASDPLKAPPDITSGSPTVPHAIGFPSIQSPEFKDTRKKAPTDTEVFAVCGNKVKIEATTTKIADFTAVTGEIFERAADGTETKLADLAHSTDTPCDIVSNKITAHWLLKDVVKTYLKEAASVKPPKKEIFARIICDTIKAQTNEKVTVRKVEDSADFEGFTTEPSHPTGNGFANLTGKYVGKIKDDELTIKVRVKYAPAWGRYLFKVGTAWMFGKLTGTDELWYYDPAEPTVNKWKSFTGWTTWATDPKVEEVIFATSGTNKTGYSYKKAAYVNWPEALSYGATELAAITTKVTESIAEVKSIWDNKFWIKRKDCKGAEDCCRWSLRVDMSMTETENPADYTINYILGAGRANVNNWFTKEYWGQNDTIHDRRANVHAHEAGHMMGAFDEYAEGGINPTTVIVDRFIASATIMDSNSSVVEARHQKDAAEFMKQLVKLKLGIDDWVLEVKKK